MEKNLTIQFSESRSPNFYTKLGLFFYLFYPYKKYQIGTVKNEDGLRKLYEFRYEIYCLRDKLLDFKNYPLKIEKDEFDDVSIHFGALDKKKNVVGCLRLIPFLKEQLPTIEEFNLNGNINKIPRDKIAEISRFATSVHHRGGFLMLELAKVMYLYSKKIGIEHWIGCAENWFLKRLDYFFGPLDYIGQPKFTFNAINYPFILSVSTAEKNVYGKGKLLFKYFDIKTRNQFF